jgi:hypothetical protein
MVDVLRSFEPLTLPLPRGAHRYDVFSPKLGDLLDTLSEMFEYAKQKDSDVTIEEI